MALPIIRLLGKEKIDITAVFGISPKNNFYHSIIRKSKFITKKIFFDESNYAHDLIEKLILSVRELDHKPVLFIASDTDLEIISNYRDILSEHFLFSLPSDTIIDKILNKEKFIELAEELDLPIPKSQKIDNIYDFKGINLKINFPFIIKPSWRNNEWLKKYKEKKVFIINDEKHLKQCIDTLKDFPTEYVIQQLIAGTDSNIYCSFAILDSNSEPLSIGFCRKLKQYPPMFGNTSIAQPIFNEELKTLSEIIFKKLRLVGYASIEFKLDEVDKRFKIIEVTPNRFNRQFATTTIQGLNLPYALYCFETGLPVTNNVLIKSKKLWLSEVNEIRRIRFYEKNKLKEYFNLVINLLRVKVFELFDMRDIKPFLFLLKTMGIRNNNSIS